MDDNSPSPVVNAATILAILFGSVFACTLAAAIIRLWDTVMWSVEMSIYGLLAVFSWVLLMVTLAAPFVAFYFVSRRRAEVKSIEIDNRLKNRTVYDPAISAAGDQVYAPAVDQAGHVQSWRPLHNPWLPALNGGSEPITPTAAEAWLAHNKLHATTSHPNIKVGDITINGNVNVANVELPAQLTIFELPAAHQPSIETIQFGLVKSPVDGSITPLGLSLAKMEHLLVSAKTRWGKSNLINVLLVQLLNAPEPVQILPIDIQNHGLALLAGHPRVVNGAVCVQPAEIAQALAWVRGQADERAGLLANVPEAADIFEYSRLTGQWVPPILVTVDEAASLLDDRELNRRHGVADELRRQVFEFGKFGIFQILLLTATNADIIKTGHRNQFTTRLAFNGGSKLPVHYVVNADSEMIGELVAAPKGRAIIECAALPLPAFIQTPLVERRTVRERLAGPHLLAAGLPPQPDIPDGLDPVEQAIWLFVQNNLDASITRLKQIVAEKTGVGETTVYRRFKDMGERGLIPAGFGKESPFQ